MAEREVWQDFAFRQKIVRVQKTQRGGLHRAAEKERRFLERVGQVGGDHLADGLAERAVEDEAERAIGIMLADENYGVLKKRAAQIAAVQQQFAFEKFLRNAHCRSQCASGMQNPQKENNHVTK